MNTPLHFPALIFVTSAFALIVSGCSSTLPNVSPDHQDPSAQTPAAFNDNVTDAPPLVISSTWWDLFNDPVLSALIETALEHNQDLAAAAHRVDQARALAGQARADLFPQLAVEAEASRQSSMQTAYQPADYVRLPGVLSYELDLWNGVRRGASAARAEADAAQYRYDAARLSLSAQVAETVYLLRAALIEEGIVTATIETRREMHEVIASRQNLGSATSLDLAQAETELAIAESELFTVARSRAQLTYALALLTGQPAPSFPIKSVGNALPSPPLVPGDLPSTVLRQRPDLAAAESTISASADRIGVARAAFYPTIRLTASAGWESNDFDSAISGSTQIWSIGPQVYLPIFQGGRNKARLARSLAEFEENYALFRQNVLVALGEVQDALTAGRLLSAQEQVNSRATTAARRAATLSRTRYDAGYVGYLEVVDSERVALSTERTQAQLKAGRLVAAVKLIKALGGGWQNHSTARQ